MNSKKSAIFSVIVILAIVALFAGTPIIADHIQASAISFPHGYAKILHSLYYGPCVNWGR